MFLNRYNDLHWLLPIGGIRCWWLLAAIMLLSILPAHATSVDDQVVQGMVPNSITLIGESHQRPKSAHFFRSLVDSYLQQNQCLTIALEIASSQQPMIDEVMQGRAVVSAIKIAPMIDHPPFRALINDLAGMRSNGACLELIAIDAEIKENTGRDEWMAAKLAVQVSQAPVLALLGNLHTLKKVVPIGPKHSVAHLPMILITFSLLMMPPIKRSRIKHRMNGCRLSRNTGASTARNGCISKTNTGCGMVVMNGKR